MHPTSKRLFLATALAVGALLPGIARAELTCGLIPKFVDAFFQSHVTYNELDPELTRKTVDTYLRRVDPSLTILLESEAEAIQASMGGIFLEVQRGDCSRLRQVHEKLLKRHQTVEAFVRALVTDDDYEIDPDVAWVVDPEDRGRPKTDKERNELITSQVHFQMSNYQAAETPTEEAVERLVHRYELRTRRFAELDPAELHSAFLDAFAGSLDPHSNYLSADVLEDFRIQMSLSLEGIGVALSERDGYSVVERIIPGGAADRIGVLQPKDKLIAVAQDGGEPVSIIDMPLRDAVSLIRGKKGTRVHLTVLRQGETTERFPVTIVRDTIDLEEQAASLRWIEHEGDDGKTRKLAILELPSFYGDADPSKRQCTDDVAKLLSEVNEKGADGLVLDLSRNGGGLLEHAVTISGFFLRRGEIVGIRDARGRRQVLPDADERVLYAGPLVVHTSRISASAAEILAGALKDYKRAVIAGDEHTFGKGTVQTVSALQPGQGALKITTAMFFRPGGESTQNGGVKADVVIPSMFSSGDFGEKYQRYALTSERISPFLSSYANAAPSSQRWKAVTSRVLNELSERSRGRIDDSEDFVEIRRKLEEAEKNDGVVRLAEVQKRLAEEQAKNAEKEKNGENGDDTESAKLSPQLEEALSVLADLVELNA